jgi:hypothetical protein
VFTAKGNHTLCDFLALGAKFTLLKNLIHHHKPKGCNETVAEQLVFSFTLDMAPVWLQYNKVLTSFAGLEGLTTLNGNLYIRVRPQADEADVYDCGRIWFMAR